VTLLLAAPGVDPNQANNTGATPLFTAAGHGHADVVALLLATPGVDPGQAFTDGSTPLFIAAQEGHAEVVTLLLATPGVDPSQAKNNGCTPLFVAAQKGHAGVVTLLLTTPGVDPSHAKNDGATPLITACHKNHPAVAALLLDHGAEPLATLGAGGKTALFHAQQHPAGAFSSELLRRLAPAAPPLPCREDAARAFAAILGLEAGVRPVLRRGVRLVLNGSGGESRAFYLFFVSALSMPLPI